MVKIEMIPERNSKFFFMRPRTFPSALVLLLISFQILKRYLTYFFQVVALLDHISVIYEVI